MPYMTGGFSSKLVNGVPYYKKSYRNNAASGDSQTGPPGSTLPPLISFRQTVLKGTGDVIQLAETPLGSCLFTNILASHTRSFDVPLSVCHLGVTFPKLRANSALKDGEWGRNVIVTFEGGDGLGYQWRIDGFIMNN